MNIEWEFFFRRRLLLVGCDVVGYGLFLIDAQISGVGPDKALIKNAAGKGVEIFLLQGIEMAFGNLGRQRDFLKRDPSQLSLAPHTLAKHAHV